MAAPKVRVRQGPPYLSVVTISPDAIVTVENPPKIRCRRRRAR